MSYCTLHSFARWLFLGSKCLCSGVAHNANRAPYGLSICLHLAYRQPLANIGYLAEIEHLGLFLVLSSALLRAHRGAWHFLMCVLYCVAPFGTF